MYGKKILYSSNSEQSSTQKMFQRNLSKKSHRYNAYELFSFGFNEMQNINYYP